MPPVCRIKVLTLRINEDLEFPILLETTIVAIRNETASLKWPTVSKEKQLKILNQNQLGNSRTWFYCSLKLCFLLHLKSSKSLQNLPTLLTDFSNTWPFLFYLRIYKYIYMYAFIYYKVPTVLSSEFCKESSSDPRNGLNYWIFYCLLQ